MFRYEENHRNVLGFTKDCIVVIMSSIAICDQDDLNSQNAYMIGVLFCPHIPHVQMS